MKLEGPLVVTKSFGRLDQREEAMGKPHSGHGHWPSGVIRRDRLEAPAIYGFEAGRSRVTLMSVCPQTYDDFVGHEPTSMMY